MDFIRLIGVIVTEYPKYLFYKKYDVSNFWNKCIRINVLYTKVLQALAVNYSSNVSYHFNDIPYDYSEIPFLCGVDEYKIIGAGMIAIVFETTEDGVVKIIKAKRNGIDEKLHYGLTQLKQFIKLLCYIPYIKSMNLQFVYEEIHETMLQQLNFEEEVKNHKKFKEMFIANPHIVIPDLYEDQCTQTQIVMTKLEGFHYNPDLMDKKQGSLYANYIMQMIVKGLVFDGIIHADLHAGNILFMEDKIGIIDFGLMLHLKEHHRNIVKLVNHIVLNQCEEAYPIIFDHFIEPAHVKSALSDEHKEDIKKTIISIYNHANSVNKCFSGMDICKAIQQINKHNVYLSIVFYKLIMTIAALELLLQKLIPNSSDKFLSYAKEMLK